MTFQDVYKNFSNYQKCCALEALENLEHAKVFRPNNGIGYRSLELQDIPFCDRTEEDWRETDEVYEAQCRLRRYLKGEEESIIYRAYWEHLKNKDFPEWRKMPEFL